MIQNSSGAVAPPVTTTPYYVCLTRSAAPRIRRVSFLRVEIELEGRTGSVPRWSFRALSHP